MEWCGDKLKQWVVSAGFTQETFSKAVGVTRPTYNAWISGQVPKGLHLIKIWSVLKIEPDVLFNPGKPSVWVVPSHRKRGSAKITTGTNQAAMALAASYSGLFDDTDVPVLQLVATQRSPEMAVKLSYEMRKLMGLGDGHTPPTLMHVFDLLAKFGVCVIFRCFPDKIKDYAFYTQIKGNRVVIANTAVSQLDLIFPLIHEAVHAVRGVCPKEGAEWDKEEDDFCDKVASLVQFPDGYIEDVRAATLHCAKGYYMETLKGFSVRHQHVVSGLVRRLIEETPQSLQKDMKPYYMADADLRKGCGTLRDLLVTDGHICAFLDNLRRFSPHWFENMQRHKEGMTVGKIAECLDLSIVDAKGVLDELATPSPEAGTKRC